VTETRNFALVLLLVAAVGLVAVLSNLITERLRVPVPVLVLVGAAVAVKYVHSLHAPPERTVERILTVALICILFEGGMHIGVARVRTAAGAIVSIGVLGTFLTAGAGALLLHAAFGLSWFASLLVATAVAPTDPAVVFSVLGKRQIVGRSGTILEGESGANDPVGIALMSSLLAAGAVSAHAFGRVGLEFALQMLVGAAIGLVGGQGLLWFMRTVRLPGEGLYPLRTLACAGLLYAVATLAHGSGFLAVFLAGILLGDEAAPHKDEIRRFHGALAGLAEIVAFVVLGLTVDLNVLAHRNVWVPGLILAVVVAFVVRPLLVGLCLLPARLRRNENAFVLFAGLKGAVPLLLGQLMLGAHVPDAGRLYGIVVVVVVFSVLVQGSLTPAAARLLRIPMRARDDD
jgi:cell volume regulation protein A